MSANKALARALAAAALADAGITSPPVDLDDLALARAIRIERHADLVPPLRAAYSPDHGLVRVVALPPTVERFPIAHELGHAILDDGGAACTQAMIHEQVDAASLADVVETFDPEATASAIASQLLVPPGWLRGAVLDGRTVAELRDLFDVSGPVLMIAILRDRLLSRVRAS
jgi:hypothetical protein